eukprot:Amastigsp_a510941_5.p2 type:complete len:403 gc:universal Amastigsp_a510941_5:61-1269(+)
MATAAGAPRAVAPVVSLDFSAQGLTEVPEAVFDHADTLETLNMSNNNLSSLPESFARLSKLRVLFLSQNQFAAMPAVLGACASLSMVAFRGNGMTRIEPEALAPSLRWLILTGNRIAELPESIGSCVRLQKLMLAGNELATLPDSMAACTGLELVRLSCNRLRSLPPWLLRLPALAWLAISGNPLVEPSPAAPPLASFDWSGLRQVATLGEGASGEIVRCETPSGDAVAVKIFKGELTSDGLPDDEKRATAISGTRGVATLTHVLGTLSGHPTGRQGLVLELIPSKFVPLARPPSFESCTRDIYPSSLRLDRTVAVRLLADVADATAALHECGLVHGDLYAHNTLWDPASGHALLSDLGAATPTAGLSAEERCMVERLDVLAFGHLMAETMAMLSCSDVRSL